MGLSLVVGPAHAGKVALLLERYLAALDRDPWLLVPGRADVERVERELLDRRGALLSGTIGTFDTLFEQLARGDDAERRLIGDAERTILVRRAVETADLRSLGRSAGFAGFADALSATLTELDASLVDVSSLEGELAALHAAYAHQLDSARAWDRQALRRRGLERLRSELSVWHARPVFAYGFEDLTGAEWRLLEALAARGEVHVSLPYEPGRAVFASLARTAADLSSLAGEDVVELEPASSRYLPPAIARIERSLFDETGERVPLDGSLRFLEGAGRRATLELVADTVLELMRSGTPAHEIALVCPSVERLGASIETAFGTLGVPVAVERRPRLGKTPFGLALTSLLRFVWFEGTRRDLFAFLRSPYGGLARADVDWLEGRLRGRAVDTGERVLEELGELRGNRPITALDLVRDATTDPEAVKTVAAAMLRHAHGTSGRPPVAELRSDLRAHDAARSVVVELETLGAAGIPFGRDEVLAALERAAVRGETPGAAGRVPVVDLERVRTRRFDVVVVLGLEQGSLPRRERVSPLLDDDRRRALDEHGARLVRPDGASRDRYLFYTACTRPRNRLVLVREAATDEGTAREPSPFWEAVIGLFDQTEVRLGTSRRPLSRLTWALEDAPTERERLRSLAELSATRVEDAIDLADVNGWGRRLDRARAAFSRTTAIRHPRALALLTSRETFRVTDLERMAGCSAAWFVERYLRPGQIDQAVDARMRGSIAHVALQRFYSQLPSAVPGADRVTPENVDAALELMSECVQGAVASGLRIDVTLLKRQELEQGLQRDLQQLVRDEAERPSPFVPRRLEASFSSYALTDGVVVSGKIDRVDADPMSARGVVVDYKSGSAPSAVQIREEARLQIPLYLLVLRDQLGLEPVGGVYVPLGGGRRPRGMLVAADDRVPGYAAADYLEQHAFDEAIDTARETAIELVGRIRAGDVALDPRGGECPSWCDLWRMCRRERP